MKQKFIPLVTQVKIFDTVHDINQWLVEKYNSYKQNHKNLTKIIAIKIADDKIYVIYKTNFNEIAESFNCNAGGA